MTSSSRLSAGAALALLLGANDVGAAMIGISFEKGRMAIIGVLAMKDMHGPSLGLCHADLVAGRGMDSSDCRSAARRIIELAKGLGVSLPEGERLDDALEGIVRETWDLVAKETP